MNATVLVIDDDRDFANSVKYLLKKQGIRVTIAADPAQALKIYSQEKMDFDLLMIDYNFKDSNVTGADLAERIKKLNPLQAFVFMSGFDEKEFLKAMLKVGASRHFIEKGAEPDTIVETIRLVLAEIGIKEKSEIPDTLEDELKRESEIRSFGMIGRSKALHSIIKQTENYRRFKSRFLILGPTGSGKELIAKAFQIPGKPFYAVDCTRFMEGQEQFLESELYGHKKGAYTGADQDKRGAFEVANGGVVFLDELHCLSLTAQSKLLRTLQEMKFRRLGDSSANEIPFDVTLVAAAKPELLSMMERGEFKEDLYYRLAKSELRIPPLSERPDDIKPLAKFFAEKYSIKHNLSRVLHPQLLRDMETYSWPGNVRELEGGATFGKLNETGEGLSFVKSRAESFGGAITVVETSTSGTVFQLKLPLAETKAHFRAMPSTDACQKMAILDDEIEFQKHAYFSSPHALLNWIEVTPEAQDCSYLVDLHLRDVVTGIDVI